MSNTTAYISSAVSPVKLANPAKRGFTLLETLIAMSLLGLVLAGAFSLLIGSYSIMRRTEETLYVNRLLETAIEMTRNLSFTDIDGDTATGITGYVSSSPIDFSTSSSLLLGTNSNILYNKGVPEVSDPAVTMALANSSGKIYFQKLNNNLYRVTAEVSYTPFRLRPGRKSLTTYISRGGIDKR